MPVNLYEFLILLDAGKASSDLDAIKGLLHGYIEKAGGQIVVGRVWDERRLTYPIEGHKKALFYMIYTRVESTKVIDIEADLRLNETVLRYMAMKILPKWEEKMLVVANDERAMAYQAMTTDDDDGMGGSDDGDRRRGGGGGRRFERDGAGKD